MPITTIWVTPPHNLLNSLMPGTVHVWRTLVDDSHERASRFRTYLSDDELAKANRCRTPHPQYQYVITRGMLRNLLSRYIGVLPTELNFTTQPRGKPTLVTPPSFFNIQFNVSHTYGMAFIALTTQHAVGIDVEWIDRKIQDNDIAARYFSEREAAYLASLSPPERTNQFFSYWTCKEAYLKMQGRGIAEGLAQCELIIDQDHLQVGFTHLNQQGQGGDCSLYRITSGSGHVGAVAIACSSAQVSYWNWEDEYLR